jgi:3-methylcrotonyl-CoA carboxylase alpha subunit
VDAEAVAGGAKALGHLENIRLNPATTRNMRSNIPRHIEPWRVIEGFQLGTVRPRTYSLAVDGNNYAASHDQVGTDKVEIPALGFSGVVSLDWSEDTHREFFEGDSNSDIIEADDAILLIRNNRQTRVSLFDPFDVDLDAMDEGGGAAIKSPMHGKLVALMVKPGDAVAKGQKVAVVEAMKMEHALASPRDGVVAEVVGEVGAQVSEGARVVVLGEEG